MLKIALKIFFCGPKLLAFLSPWVPAIDLFTNFLVTISVQGEKERKSIFSMVTFASTEKANTCYSDHIFTSLDYISSCLRKSPKQNRFWIVSVEKLSIFSMADTKCFRYGNYECFVFKPFYNPFTYSDFRTTKCNNVR